MMTPDERIAALERRLVALTDELSVVRQQARDAGSQAMRASHESIGVEETMYAAILDHKRETKELLSRMAVDANARRSESRGGFVAVAVLLFLGWVIKAGELKGPEIAVLAAALLGSLGVFLRSVDKRAKREKDSIAPPPR